MTKKFKYRRVTVRFHKPDGSVQRKAVGDLIRYIDGQATVRFNDDDSNVHRYQMVTDIEATSAAIAMFRVGIKAFTDADDPSVLTSISGL